VFPRKISAEDRTFFLFLVLFGAKRFCSICRKFNFSISIRLVCPCILTKLGGENFGKGRLSAGKPEITTHNGDILDRDKEGGRRGSVVVVVVENREQAGCWV